MHQNEAVQDLQKQIQRTAQHQKDQDDFQDLIDHVRHPAAGAIKCFDDIHSQ
jgi:hypothetical protein